MSRIHAIIITISLWAMKLSWLEMIIHAPLLVVLRILASKVGRLTQFWVSDQVYVCSGDYLCLVNKQTDRHRDIHTQTTS